MQMKFEVSDLEFLLAISLFFIFTPGVASQHGNYKLTNSEIPNDQDWSCSRR